VAKPVINPAPGRPPVIPRPVNPFTPATDQPNPFAVTANPFARTVNPFALTTNPFAKTGSPFAPTIPKGTEPQSGPRKRAIHRRVIILRREEPPTGPRWVLPGSEADRLYEEEGHSHLGNLVVGELQDFDQLAEWKQNIEHRVDECPYVGSVTRTFAGLEYPPEGCTGHWLIAEAVDRDWNDPAQLQESGSLRWWLDQNDRAQLVWPELRRHLVDRRTTVMADPLRFLPGGHDSLAWMRHALQVAGLDVEPGRLVTSTELTALAHEHAGNPQFAGAFAEEVMYADFARWRQYRTTIGFSEQGPQNEYEEVMFSAVLDYNINLVPARDLNFLVFGELQPGNEYNAVVGQYVTTYTRYHSYLDGTDRHGLTGILGWREVVMEPFDADKPDAPPYVIGNGADQ
jgi:hypothetical protein